MTLGQAEVGPKPNQLTAVDELLDFVDVRGTIITVDAIGAQKSIAKSISDEGSDYVFAIKYNHLKLAHAIR